MVTQPDWVLLSYRLPREPSTPRIAVWRKLKALGVVQLGEGLVALPNDARTREHLEWIAATIAEADGEAIVWTADPTRRRDSAGLADQMRTARTLEFNDLAEEVAAGTTEANGRTIARWRRTWNRIDRRDYFRSPGRSEAKQAIAEVTNSANRSGAQP